MRKLVSVLDQFGPRTVFRNGLCSRSEVPVYKLCRPLVIMSEKIKIGDHMMRCYDSIGDMAWLKKAKLVAKFMEIKDIASFISLYLEGDALALYLEMSEVD